MEHILSLIGLAKKAGRIEIGEEPVGSAARAKKARVILVANDAAAGSVRRAKAFSDIGACLMLRIDAGKDELGRALGRSSCAMAAVTDIGFADTIVKKLAALNPQQYADASQKLELKAQRALQRRREQQQHEKNLRQGKKRTTPVSSAPAGEEKKSEPDKKRKSFSSHSRTKQRRKTNRNRFENARPVKKGKGSQRKKQ